MPNAQDPIESLRIATPCQASWQRMAGDERVRHCTLCSLNVYNFAEMTRDEVSKREVKAVADANCAFKFVCLNVSNYRVEVILAGVKPVTMEHLELKASAVTHVSVALRLDTAETIIMGGISVDPLMDNGI